jgi:hypothetical protein
MVKKYKKLWEELIVYFSLIEYGSHRKWRLQQFFDASTTFLQSGCLTMMGGYTHSRTLVWYMKWAVQVTMSQIILLLLLLFVAAAASLPSRSLATYTYTHRLMGGIYEVRRWDGLSCYDTHTKFYEEWFGQSNLMWWIHRHTESKVVSSACLYF